MLEFIKNPQEKFEANMLINMGQILSLPLIIWGLVLIVRALRRPSALEDFERKKATPNTNKKS